MAKAKAKTEEVKEEKKTKVAGKKADQVVIDEVINTVGETSVDDIVSKNVPGIDIAAGEDQTVETYARATPFGVEVWDPETKSTTFKANG